MFYDLKILSRIQDELGDASSIFTELHLGWISSITQPRQFICRIRTSLTYRSVLRGNPDCGRAQHCRHRASGIQDEGEIQLRVQLAHVGNNKRREEMSTPLQVPFAIISLRVHRAVPCPFDLWRASDEPPPHRLFISHEGQHFFFHASHCREEKWRPEMRSAACTLATKDMIGR